MKTTLFCVGLLFACLGMGSALAQSEGEARGEAEAGNVAQEILAQRAKEIRMSRWDASIYMKVQIVDQFTAERNSKKQLKIKSSTGN